MGTPAVFGVIHSMDADVLPRGETRRFIPKAKLLAPAEGEKAAMSTLLGSALRK